MAGKNDLVKLAGSNFRFLILCAKMQNKNHGYLKNAKLIDTSSSSAWASLFENIFSKDMECMS